jgi:hypothetical protein
LESVPKHIGLSASDLEMLTGLPAGYFSGRSNLVQFARLRDRTPPQKSSASGGNVVVPFSSRS